MRLAVVLAASLAVAGAGATAFAQATHSPAAKKDCIETAKSTVEMRACAGSTAKAADARLNKAYADLLRYVGGAERAQLVAAQRAWLAFRDKDCAFFGGGDGTLAPVNDAYCRANLSTERAKELEAWPPNASRDAINPIR